METGGSLGALVRGVKGLTVLFRRLRTCWWWTWTRIRSYNVGRKKEIMSDGEVEVK